LGQLVLFIIFVRSHIHYCSRVR